MQHVLRQHQGEYGCSVSDKHSAELKTGFTKHQSNLLWIGESEILNLGFTYPAIHNSVLTTSRWRNKFRMYSKCIGTGPKPDHMVLGRGGRS